jgi:hypothetical protein
MPVHDRIRDPLPEVNIPGSSFPQGSLEFSQSLVNMRSNVQVSIPAGTISTMGSSWSTWGDPPTVLYHATHYSTHSHYSTTLALQYSTTRKIRYPLPLWCNTYSIVLAPIPLYSSATHTLQYPHLSHSITH